MRIKRRFLLLLGGKDVTMNTRWHLVCFVVLWMLTHRCEAQYSFCELKNGTYSVCTPTPMTITKVAKVTIAVEPKERTCGLKGAEYYFRLGKKTRPLVCDASSTMYNHPPAYMIDSITDATWWQSVTWTIPDYNNNRNSFPINITLSFNKMFRMTENVTITFNSGRPQKMILLKSMDYGQTWTDIQYYARDCNEFPGSPSMYSTSTPTAVICSESYSQDRSSPNPGGKVFFPGSTERLKSATRVQYYELLEKDDLKGFLSFTDLRIMLVYPATDSREKLTQKSAGDFYQYYYAISNIEVIASCFCHQHARSCVVNAKQQMECVCSHNTGGRDCEECLPLFNERPWRPGNFSVFPNGQANECVKCVCNDHADSCTYNSTYGRGVCNKCTNNTTGSHCELCLDTFYPNKSLPLSAPEICLSCNCEPLGITDNGKCQQKDGDINTPVGQCTCKPLVTHRRCDTCIDQYYGLLEGSAPGSCTACGCNLDGTLGKSNVCNQTDGQCPCKVSTTGRQCNMCKDGFYQFPTARPDKECTPCGCDPGGSKMAVCDTTYGVCTCRDHLKGPKCSSVETDFYIPSLDDLVLQPDGGDCAINGDLWKPENPFDGNVFAQCKSKTGSTVDFKFTDGSNEQLYFIWPHYVGVRYSLYGSTQRVVNQLEITVDGDSGADLAGVADDKGNSIGTTCPQTTQLVTTIQIVFEPGLSSGWVSEGTTVNLDRRCRYKFKLRIQVQQQETGDMRIDSIVLVPALSYSAVGKSFAEYSESGNTTQLTQKFMTCVRKLTSLLTRDDALQHEPCSTLLKSLGAELYNGGRACNCDLVGSVAGTRCQTNGGQCQCKLGVTGRRCDLCRPGYFNFTAAGCQRCPVLPCSSIIVTPTSVTITTASEVTTVTPSSDVSITQSAAVSSTTTVLTSTSTQKSYELTSINNTNTSLSLIGLYLGLAFGILVFIVICLVAAMCCRGVKMRKPKFGVRVSDVFGRHYNAKRTQKQHQKHLQSLTQFGVLNTNSPAYSKDENEQQYSWISGEDPLNNNKTASQENQDSVQDIPMFYFPSNQDPTGTSVATVHAQGHQNGKRMSSASNVPDAKKNGILEPSKPKDLNSNRADYRNKMPQRYDSDRPMRVFGERQPTFETFKSENPITVPLITVPVKKAPAKPPRIKPPVSKQNSNKKQTSKKRRKGSVKNSKLDMNSSKQNLVTSDYLSDDGETFAGFDSFDEINGSLV